MSVGLPGSGIGGVFYLLSALWMPVTGAHRSMRGRPSKARVVAQQSIMAALILLALWGTGVAIDILISTPHNPGALREALTADGESAVPHVFRAASFALTFGTLAAVLVLVQVLRFVVPKRVVEATDPELTDRKAA